MEADALKIMSYNILYDDEHRWGVEYAWNARAGGIYAIVHRHAPDLIGFQEVLSRQFSDLETALPGYASIGRRRNPDPGHTFRPWCMNPIFYNAGRLLPRGSGLVWLSEIHEDGTPLIGWPESREIDRNYRHAIWCIFQDKNTGADFFHLNTHWPVSDASSVHPYCAQLILEVLESHASGLPCVLTGDFNRRENLFEPAGLADAWTAGAGAPGRVTGSKINRETRQLVEGSAIDHIFVNSRVKILEFDALDEKPMGRYPSDHLPILCAFSLSCC